MLELAHISFPCTLKVVHSNSTSKVETAQHHFLSSHFVYATITLLTILHAAGLHGAANPEEPPKVRVKDSIARPGTPVGEGDGEEVFNEEESPLDKKRTMNRSHSLGSIDEWGVYMRDEEATNPLFDKPNTGSRMT